MDKKFSLSFQKAGLPLFSCWDTVDNPEMGAVGFGSPCSERRGFEVSANITSPQVFELMNINRNQIILRHL